ncbi:MAG: hypothetical protein GY857_08755 [Desulfobacula sp.]|nr:hypothetical protein [Desulfobacula sp.]
MDGLNERRMYERYADQSDIVFSTTGSINFNNAQLNNCSSGGMYFNSNFEVIRGSDLCIKMTDYCSVFYAKVARCQEMKVDGKISYGVGIEYLEPVS